MKAKEKKELMVIAVGLVVLAVVLFSNLRKEGKKDSGPVSEETVVSEGREVATAAAQGAGRPKNSLDVRRKQEATLSKPYGRDPFIILSSHELEVPTSEPEPTSISLILRAISIRKGAAPLAVINSSLVRVGDTIENAKVVEIHNDYVLLRKDGREYKLKPRN